MHGNSTYSPMAPCTGAPGQLCKFRTTVASCSSDNQWAGTCHHCTAGTRPLKGLCTGITANTTSSSLCLCGLDDVRVSRVGDGQHAHTEQLTASGTQVHVVWWEAKGRDMGSSVSRQAEAGTGIHRRPRDTVASAGGLTAWPSGCVIWVSSVVVRPGCAVLCACKIIC